MKKLLILIFLYPLCSSAQQMKTFNNCSETKAFQLLKGDTIVQLCDTAYMLNGSTYKIFKSTYEIVRNNKDKTRELVMAYEELLKVQEKRISEQSAEYTALKAKFDEVVATSLQFIDKTNINLISVKDSINAANQNIIASRALIDQSIVNIKKEQKKKFLSNLYYGLGGFGIGIVATSILLLVK